MPVVPDYARVFQWVRELKRGGYRSSCAVTFVIPDDQPVLVGQFHQPHVEVGAAQAVALFRDRDDVFGFQVLVPRKIERSELRSVKPAPDLAGWRYYPEAKSRKPTGWPRGEIKARRLRQAIEAASQPLFLGDRH